MASGVPSAAVLAATLGIISFLASGCLRSDAFVSDPAAWMPAARVGEPDAGAGDAASDAAPGEVPPPCPGEPLYDPTLVVSSTASLSHRAGESCLAGCHEVGGSAMLTLAAAGTIYEAAETRAVAAAGNTVRNVGGAVLVLDRCGNFYATAAGLTINVKSTQPYVENPTFRRMEKPINRIMNAGDCNQSGCHDFSSKEAVGIFY